MDIDYMDKYSAILQEYPEYMTQTDFYQIAHIAKRTARKLLLEGKVPCVYSGKKTRNFKIKTCDVVNYLIDRDLHPELHVNKRTSKVGYRPRLYDSLPALSNLSIQQQQLYQSLFEDALKDAPDILSVAQLNHITGYSSARILSLCKDHALPAYFQSNSYIIPKLGFIEFLVSEAGSNLRCKPQWHCRIIHEFLSLI